MSRSAVSVRPHPHTHNITTKWESLSQSQHPWSCQQRFTSEPVESVEVFFTQKKKGRSQRATVLVKCANIFPQGSVFFFLTVTLDVRPCQPGCLQPPRGLGSQSSRTQVPSMSCLIKLARVHFTEHERPCSCSQTGGSSKLQTHFDPSCLPYFTSVLHFWCKFYVRKKWSLKGNNDSSIKSCDTWPGCCIHGSFLSRAVSEKAPQWSLSWSFKSNRVTEKMQTEADAVVLILRQHFSDFDGKLKQHFSWGATHGSDCPQRNICLFFYIRDEPELSGICAV